MAVDAARDAPAAAVAERRAARSSTGFSRRRSARAVLIGRPPVLEAASARRAARRCGARWEAAQSASEARLSGATNRAAACGSRSSRQRRCSDRRVRSARGLAAHAGRAMCTARGRRTASQASAVSGRPIWYMRQLAESFHTKRGV